VLPDPNSLVELFHERAGLLARFDQVSPADMPEVYRSLLDHDQHMTVTVESYHGCPVDVVVLEYSRRAEMYSRQILLTRQRDGRVVQFGIVRLRLDCLSGPVRTEIEARQIPLGRVLIAHDVLRKVELGKLWRVTPGPPLTRFFGLESPTVTYGRTAIIHCDGEPAVELLEIVAPEEPDAGTRAPRVDR
jgi:chorismate-pyruvate lyase